MTVTAFVAGFVAVLVGYTGSAAIIFQAASSAGANEAQIASWMGALGVAMGLTTIGLSLKYKMPILTAWSTPGAAILVTALSGVAMSDAIGAFVFCGALIALTGITGIFQNVMDRLPTSLATALLAGVLARFGMDVFVQMEKDFVIVLTLFVLYLIGKRAFPRFVMIAVFAAVILIAGLFRGFHPEQVIWQITQPVWTTPSFDLGVMLSVGVPLYIVTMASQNAPGVAVLHTHGYRPPLSPIMTSTGLSTLLLAPFGCFAINLAAITAAICASDNSHPDPNRRYWSTISAGLFYLLTGIFAVSVVSLFVAFPESMVLALAGLALFSTIAGSLQHAMQDKHRREPALITFLVTLSGVTLFGVGSAFWGLIAGAISLGILTKSR
ncbi:MAG: benzoate/H(+) symporter BenE family transporter [Pseudomonadota bacterium]